MTLADRTRPQPALQQHIDAAQAYVRGNPEHADGRARLFQWLAVAGDWQRARSQLEWCAKLAPQAAPTLALYRSAIDGEQARQAAFAGEQPPAWFGTRPEPAWLGHALQGLRPGADLNACFEQVREQAGAMAGSIAVQATENQDGLPRPFAWIGDGDSRIAPVCEIIAGGRYGWLPYEDIRRIRMEPPQGLCDLVWAQARIDLADGREQPCLIPARYPAGGGVPDYAEQDEAALMSRRTAWSAVGPGSYLGIGQKMLMTDQGEYALLDVREIVCGDGAGLPAR
ncbi:type VI secretion system accessory protein TagJ [Orrella sp. JC864]|uniref:type VI secretion system accessory protein TagJ n=1 Tax=Orrella sp. JC864 TaxID=3120298 RepID=UPI0012BBA3F0